ncbi:MAG: ABC transporter permease [Candidatus Polarisedimenticolia bacterium]
MAVGLRDLETLPSAVSNLARHKLRTLLTMLGIVFGVGAVISMLSIGAGAQAEAQRVIDAMGLRNILVREKPVEDRDLFAVRERSLGLSQRDLEELTTVVHGISGYSPKKRVRVDRVLSAGGRSDGQVLGVGRDWFELMNLKVASGALFDAYEEQTFQRVCVLGHRARQDLFAYEDPIGKAVKVNDVWFTVIGTLQPRDLGKESFQGVEIESGDNSLFIPITAALKMFDRPRLASELDEIALQVEEGGSIEGSTTMVSQVLKGLHSGQSDFTLVVPEELLAQSRRTRRIFNIVMGGIAGISLLVGGIGIMNIMLASVLERTREIGVRRALGATRRDILHQFLTESVLISLMGGLTGVMLGFSIAWGVSLFSDWKTVVTGLSIALSFGFSVAVGLIFGTYPAMNAARLDPIEALRHE